MHSQCLDHLLLVSLCNLEVVKQTHPHTVKHIIVYSTETYQEFERGVTDGIYYLTFLNASVSPSTSNFNDFFFSQQTVDLYPAFDRDNPVADPAAAVSIADNETLGLVTTTDGASPTPNEDTQRSQLLRSLHNSSY